MIRTVLFDIDGTLVDSNDAHVAAWDAAFRAAGHVVGWQAIHDQIGKGADNLVPALVPGGDVEALAEAHGAIFKGAYLPGVKAFPGAADLLRRVAAAGARVVLASSASAAEVAHHVALLGVEDVVAATTSADDVERSKPAPDIFAAALAKVGAAAAATLVVGDTPYDIAAAARCELRTVAVRSGGFDDAALAGAVAIYDDVAALLAGYETSPLAG